MDESNELYSLYQSDVAELKEIECGYNTILEPSYRVFTGCIDYGTENPSPKLNADDSVDTTGLTCFNCKGCEELRVDKFLWEVRPREKDLARGEVPGPPVAPEHRLGAQLRGIRQRPFLDHGLRGRHFAGPGML